MNLRLGMMLAREVEQRSAAIELAIADLGDKALWRRVAPATNAPGNLVLHLIGNLSKYVLAGVGRRVFERNRPAEFTASGIPAKELLSRFKDTIDGVIHVLRDTDDARLAAPYEDPEFSGLTCGAVAIHAIEHLGYHTGQIVLLVKVLGSGAFLADSRTP